MAKYEYSKKTVDENKAEYDEEIRKAFNFHEDDFEAFTKQDLSIKEIITEMNTLEEAE